MQTYLDAKGTDVPGAVTLVTWTDARGDCRWCSLEYNGTLKV